jgi:hypothetical protein
MAMLLEERSVIQRPPSRWHRQAENTVTAHGRAFVDLGKIFEHSKTEVIREPLMLDWSAPTTDEL